MARREEGRREQGVMKLWEHKALSSLSASAQDGGREIEAVYGDSIRVVSLRMTDPTSGPYTSVRGKAADGQGHYVSGREERERARTGVGPSGRAGPSGKRRRKRESEVGRASWARRGEKGV